MQCEEKADACVVLADVDALELGPRTRCVTVVNPSNPTGAVMSAHDLQR